MVNDLQKSFPVYGNFDCIYIDSCKIIAYPELLYVMIMINDYNNVNDTIRVVLSSCK